MSNLSVTIDYHNYWFTRMGGHKQLGNSKIKHVFILHFLLDKNSKKCGGAPQICAKSHLPEKPDTNI